MVWYLGGVEQKGRPVINGVSQHCPQCGSSGCHIVSHRVALGRLPDDDAASLVSEEFGRRLRASRRRRGLSQRTAAELVGLSQGFLSMVENGKRRLNRHRDIIALAELLEVDPRSFSEE